MGGKYFNSNYDDIINMEHPKSKKHKQMSIHDRAAQFAPFSALTGYDEEVKKTAEDLQEQFLDDGSKKSSLESFED